MSTHHLLHPIAIDSGEMLGAVVTSSNSSGPTLYGNMTYPAGYPFGSPTSPASITRELKRKALEEIAKLAAVGFDEASSVVRELLLIIEDLDAEITRQNAQIDRLKREQTQRVTTPYKLPYPPYDGTYPYVGDPIEWTSTDSNPFDTHKVPPSIKPTLKK